jgi:threonine synthase
MAGFLGYQCSVCAAQYAPDEISYTCPQDGGNLDVMLDYKGIRGAIDPQDLENSADRSIWRYLPLLPVDDPEHEGTVLRAVGWTPMLAPPRLRKKLDLPHLWVKDDGRNPTASFKDRASAVVVARAEQIGAEVAITASTGNAGAALAGMAAAVGLPAVILAPKTAPSAKIAQLLIFGAKVFLVDGTYDDAFDLSLLAAEEFGWYCRNTGYNPFTAEGKKTAAFEICEQFSSMTNSAGERTWQTPDAVFVSVGDGNIISGLHKGFKDMMELGWIDRLPRLFGVQSTGSAALYNAFVAETEQIKPVRADTLADSISVDLPRDGLRALRAATTTGGAYLAVEDEAILAAMLELSQLAAVFAEPAGATAYAGLVRAAEMGLVGGQDRIVVLNTGSGLKDVKAAMQASGEATIIEPSLKALRKALD